MFLYGSGLNLLSDLRNRSGVMLRYRSIAPSPACPMYEANAGSILLRSEPFLIQAGIRWTANVNRRVLQSRLIALPVAPLNSNNSAYFPKIFTKSIDR